MKKYLLTIAVVCVAFMVGCQSKTAAQKSYDGTYSFDVTAWTTAMGEVDPNFKNVPQEIVGKMTQTFSEFNMVVAGKAITANFGATVMEGALEELSRTENEVKYKMVPKLEEAKDQVIVVTITGNSMVAGPEGDKRQLMYFTKK